MTRDEWIKQYVARLVPRAAWAETDAVAVAKAGADASEQAGWSNPDELLG